MKIPCINTSANPLPCYAKEGDAGMDTKETIERLRIRAQTVDPAFGILKGEWQQVADRLEALEAENERLQSVVFRLRDEFRAAQREAQVQKERAERLREAIRDAEGCEHMDDARSYLLPILAESDGKQEGEA